MTRTRALELSSVGDLNNEQRLRILGIIDKLRELGVSENVSLPQIVLRRAPASEAEVKFTIIPGPDAQGDEETLDHLLGFERTLSTEEFDSESLRTIFDEV
ncbi:hypothetical protein PMIN04_011858 [Paraphaeosphaeria minitans]